ncbi:MAG TPA: response regulator [Pyrinomonadaceae bacterium]|nr:response regulator [Pyrinomonadaceae bacterium]
MENLQNMNEVEVLLVEDNPSDAELTMRALKKRNLANKLFHVKDGAAAIDFVFALGAYSNRRVENGPKVVLLDLKLPKVDGIEVLRRIKSDERTKTIPVVVMTSSREDRDLANCYELGVNGYVVKPVEFEDFARAVSELGFYWLLLNETVR